MILNGVCVIWRGWIDLQRLDGMGFLEYDDERAQVPQVFLTRIFVVCSKSRLCVVSQRSHLVVTTKVN